MKSNDNRNSIESRARRRVDMKLGFGLHALVFVLVNLGLYTIHTLGGEPRWPHGSWFPLWGWGLGLAIHGIVTLVRLQGDGLRARMIDSEVERLQRSER